MLVLLSLVGSYFCFAVVGFQWPWGPPTLKGDGRRFYTALYLGSVQSGLQASSGGTQLLEVGYWRCGPLCWYGELPRLDRATFYQNLLRFQSEERVIEGGGVTLTFADAPAWVFMPLCLIAPVMWLRRRRRERSRGFPVVAGPEASAEA